VRVPVLSAGNWGGQGLHLRGNVEGYVRAASEHKWLEMHGGEHWTSFYTDYGVDLQKRFFGHYLKGEDNGWERQAPVQLQIRHVDGTFTARSEEGWPLPRTAWTRLYLDAAGRALAERPHAAAASVSYDPRGDGITFEATPVSAGTEVTGPLAAKLFVSAEAGDADLFLIVRVFSPAGEEVVFQGAIDPHTPMAQGWLRASHRKPDPKLTLPYRPYHTHDEPRPLEPGAVHELDIEILPTCLVMPAGYRISLTVRGTDYVYPGGGGHLSNFKNELTGCGPFLHDDPVDRPPAAGGRVTLHTGTDHPSYLLLPVIPEVSNDR
jgi:predicted acyl esterase